MILALVGCVHAEQEIVPTDAVNHNVIDERSLRGREGRILALSYGQPAHVVAGKSLEILFGRRSLQFNFTHVADVEDAGAGSYGHVLLDRTLVLDRHFPPAEIDHAGAGLAMDSVQSGS